jgi:hypothetical protein
MVMKKVQYLILNYLSNTIQYRLLLRKYVAKVTKKDSVIFLFLCYHK